MFIFISVGKLIIQVNIHLIGATKYTQLLFNIQSPVIQNGL